MVALLFAAGCIWGDDDSGSGTQPFDFTACGADVDDMTNGTIDATWRYSYDTSGCPTLDEYDLARDGTINSRYAYQYELYQGTCRILTMTSDDQADGKIDSKYIYMYAGSHETTQDTDSNGDGTIDSRATYVYEGDRISRVDNDDGLDGTIDSVSRYTYDGAGKVSAIETDSNMDGKADMRITYQRDARDHITRMEMDYTGPGGTGTADGIPDFIFESFYDGDTLTRSTSDDGTAPIDSTMTYRYSCP